MTLTIICRGSITPPIQFGLSKLQMALEEKKCRIKYDEYWNSGSIFLLVGCARERMVQISLERAEINTENKTEGILLVKSSTDDARPLTIVSGTDDIGVMYALCELASRITAQGMAALDSFEKIMEYPSLAHRIVGRFLHSERDDSWFFSDSFWDYYTERLAINRINRLHLITGMDTAYMSPPYPFLISTPGYEEVEAISKENPQIRREKCLHQMRKIGELCHERGIEFCFGIWQQRPWTENQKTLVKNCPSDEKFADYAQKSLIELIRCCPEIDILSFRVNPEAGVKDSNGNFDTAQEFWYGMLRAIKSADHRVKVELRAKGLTDSMTQYALSLGLDLTIPTKAWCEHIALPYQMLQMRQEEVDSNITNESSARRYSYDNLQCIPRSYDLQYRLWNYGSTNILLWGEPYHVSRFIKSCIAGQATGFEFTAPLSMKGGHALIPGDEWPIHIHPDMQTYHFEDERYWMWYLSFGRLSYNPDASADIWQREMRIRFGKYARDMELAYIASSRILPLITTAHFPEHPSMHYWPELYGSAALFAENNYEPWFTADESPRRKNTCYANADPSDETLFCSIENYIESSLNGLTLHCYSPLEVGDWYYALAIHTMDAVERLKFVPDNSEIRASVIDFTMLAHLGFYHAYMVQASYHLCMHNKTQKSNHLIASYEAMYHARQAFSEISQLGTVYYARNLEFDSGDSTKRNGNWQDRLEHQVDADLEKLETLLTDLGISYAKPQTEEYHSLVKPSIFPMSFRDDVPQVCIADTPLKITLSFGFQQALKVGAVPILHYRNVNMREGKFRQIQMEATGDVYTATIPGDYITATYNLYVYFTCEDLNGNIHIHPGIYHPEQAMPVYVVKTMERGEIS